MKFNYTLRGTKKIKDYLERLKVARQVVDILPRFPYLEENIRRQSLLKSSLFSARIEGNKLHLEEVQMATGRPTKNQAKIEVFNILKALHFVYSSQAPKKLSQKFILKLHALVLDKISPLAGSWRRQPSAIFNQAGIAVYLTPAPDELPFLIKQFISQNNQVKYPGPIQAALAHFIFEKIHPFLDGNGRVGRLISTFLLKNSGFGFRGLVSMEEYLEKERQTYYDLLLFNKKDITSFIEFFLQVLTDQAEKTLDQLKNIQEEEPVDSLLPRRQEILHIVRDHQLASFDFLKRRFAKIKPSTLHYDLQQLIKKGYLKKLGVSRGVLYVVNQK
jgi:Fic family protein